MTDASESRLPPGISNAPAPVDRPEELPPVAPPSAGYIVQLFLIPALIVAAVIGVWALFGKLADAETDWQQLVAELGSSNEHRRWRAALGLAQVLRNQQLANDANEVALAERPEVARALTDLLQESIESHSTLEADVKHQEFLARTLGSLNVDDVVLPALGDAVAPDRNIEVRKSSLMALAMIAGRHFQKRADALETTVVKTMASGEKVYMLREPLAEPTITDPKVWQQLKLAAQDEEPSVRHLAGFVLALLSGEEAVEQLKVMLLDRDSMSRANAAVGLARSGRADGVAVLTELLRDGTMEISREEFQLLLPEEQTKSLSRRQFEQPMILGSCLRAVHMLWEKMSAEEQQSLRPILQKLGETSDAADIRMLAKEVLRDR